MKVLEKKAVKELIKFYELYINSGDIKIINKMAEKIYLEYIPGHTLLSDTVNAAVGPLIGIYVNTGIKPVSKERAKEILKSLRELEKKL